MHYYIPLGRFIDLFKGLNHLGSAVQAPRPTIPIDIACYPSGSPRIARDKRLTGAEKCPLLSSGANKVDDLRATTSRALFSG